MTLNNGNMLLACVSDILTIEKTQEKVKKCMIEIMKTGESTDF